MKEVRESLVSLIISVAITLTIVLSAIEITRSSLLNRATAGFIVSTSNYIQSTSLYLQATSLYLQDLKVKDEDINELNQLTEKNRLVTVELENINIKIKAHWWKAPYYFFKYGDDLQNITNNLLEIKNDLSRLRQLK